MGRVIPPFLLHRLRLCCCALLAAGLAVSLLASILGGCDVTAGAASAGPSDHQPPHVRVLVASAAQSVRLRGTAAPLLEAPGLGGAVRLALPEEAVSVVLSDTGWRIGNQSFQRGTLLFAPAGDGTLSIDGRRYRGSLRFVPSRRQHNRFDIVNELDIESYLMGVLPKELPPTFNATTYEAQAVVARTYAIWELKNEGARRGHFDLYDDEKSQVYGGIDAESEKGRRAVEKTRGQVVVHDTPAGPRIFKAYFHSTSGGATLGVESAFNEPPIRALSAQSLDDYSRDSSKHRWPPVVLAKDEMARRLKLWGERAGNPVKRIGKVDRLEIAQTNAFGRPTRFEIVDTRGNRYSLIPEELRWALNTGGSGTTVYSGYFTPINNETNIVISDGRGWGHGVGMCQFTAEAWANEGRDHLQIVTASYPGTTVVRAY